MSETFNPDDWQAYTSSYSDLAHMSREQAIRHYETHGRKEGRVWNGKRAYFAKTYLKGDGIEIGALHNPLFVWPQARVKYVDVRDSHELNAHYPELGAATYRVDIVDDGETLSTIADGSLDFIIANHFLEHAEDFIGTVQNHVKKLRAGGIGYYATPDKRHSFDKDREMTTWEEMLADHADGGHNSRRRHYVEWVTLVDKAPEAETEERVDALMKKRYSIHFSVADFQRWCEHFASVQRHLNGAFRMLEACENHPLHETIHILQKL